MCVCVYVCVCVCSRLCVRVQTQTPICVCHSVNCASICPHTHTHTHIHHHAFYACTSVPIIGHWAPLMFCCCTLRAFFIMFQAESLPLWLFILSLLTTNLLQPRLSASSLLVVYLYLVEEGEKGEYRK